MVTDQIRYVKEKKLSDRAEQCTVIKQSDTDMLKLWKQKKIWEKCRKGKKNNKIEGNNNFREFKDKSIKQNNEEFFYY